MVNLYVVVISLIIIFISWYYFYSYYSQKYRDLKQSFFDSNNNITLLCTPKSIIVINKAGLDFLGFKSLKSLKASHASIADFFISEENCMDKYTYGINWISHVYNDKKNSKNIVRVKMFSKIDMLDHYFYIKVSKMNKSNQYILSFSDITDIELEKNKIKTTAELDPLTQIYNRVKLNELFNGIFYHAKKHSSPVTIILFDIDHFKHINDEYGHNVGDKVLKELSGLVRGLLRKGDIFARWGGEEFVIILQDTPLAQTTTLASRLRKEIDKYVFDTVEHVTCSFGVTEFTQGDTQSLFFERVDKALYEAKENGRNQVVTK